VVDEDSDDIYSVSYIIVVPTAISVPSVDTIMVMRTSTKSRVEVIYPKDKQLSDAPLTGKFFIECRNTHG
jgi:hypothetical protein